MVWEAPFQCRLAPLPRLLLSWRLNPVAEFCRWLSRGETLRGQTTSGTLFEVLSAGLGSKGSGTDETPLRSPGLSVWRKRGLLGPASFNSVEGNNAGLVRVC